MDENGPRYAARKNEVDLDTIGGRIIAARKEQGMSQHELADLIGVVERSLQAYEMNDVVPYRKLKELSEVLNRPMAWLLHGENADKPVGDLEPVLRDILDVLHDIRAQGGKGQ